MRVKLVRMRQIWFGRLILVVLYLVDDCSREFFPTFALPPRCSFNEGPF